MRIYEQVGFGYPVSSVWLERTREIANGVRGVIPIGSHTEQIRTLVRNFTRAGFTEQIWMIAPWDMWGEAGKLSNIRDDKGWRPRHENTAAEARQVAHELELARVAATSYIEIGPELNIDSFWKKEKNWNHYLDTFAACYSAIREASETVKIISGSVSNLADDGREFLKKLARDIVQRDVYQSFHPYRTTVPATYFRDFESEDAAARWATTSVFPRPTVITEAGWHNARQTESSGLFGIKKRSVQWSEKESARFTAEDIALWRRHGVEAYTHFQIKDGDPKSTHMEAHFGAFRQDGTQKAVAGVLAALKEAA